MPKRFRGGVIAANLPNANNSQASGMWDESDSTQQIGSGCWPGTPNLNPPPTGYEAQYLLVAGGGGGGGACAGGCVGGGGGGGGVLLGNLKLCYGCCYSIIVGAAGSAGPGTSPYQGGQGNNSCFCGGSYNMLACGGGGGGSATLGGAAPSGGSGGGGGAQRCGGSGTPGQGYNGGNCATGADACFSSSGGGGAGGCGEGGFCLTSSAFGGRGGPGLSSCISGSLQTYAGGGNGSFACSLQPACCNTTAGYGQGGASGEQGGGATCCGSSGNCGVAIISYNSPVAVGSGGSISSYTCNGLCYFVHTFSSSGCYCT